MAPTVVRSRAIKKRCNHEENPVPLPLSPAGRRVGSEPGPARGSDFPDHARSVQSNDRAQRQHHADRYFVQRVCQQEHHLGVQR